MNRTTERELRAMRWVLADVQLPARKPRTKTAMLAFLDSLDRYHTDGIHRANGGSYAVCVKIWNLITSRAEDELILGAMAGDDSQFFYDVGGPRDAAEEFHQLHPEANITLYGRSSGWAVLVPSERRYGNLTASAEDSADTVRWVFDLAWDFCLFVNYGIVRLLEFAAEHAGEPEPE